MNPLNRAFHTKKYQANEAPLVAYFQIFNLNILRPKKGKKLKAKQKVELNSINIEHEVLRKK